MGMDWDGITIRNQKRSTGDAVCSSESPRRTYTSSYCHDVRDACRVDDIQQMYRESFNIAKALGVCMYSYSTCGGRVHPLKISKRLSNAGRVIGRLSGQFRPSGLGYGAEDHRYVHVSPAGKTARQTHKLT